MPAAYHFDSRAPANGNDVREKEAEQADKRFLDLR